MEIRVACITDRDLPKSKDEETKSENDILEIIKNRIYSLQINGYEKESEIIDKKAKYESEEMHIRAYISPLWTLEFEIANSCLSELLLKAIFYSKKTKQLENEITKEIDKFVEIEMSKFEKTNNNLKTEEKLYNIFKPINLKQVQKAVVAQILANLILKENKVSLKEKLLKDSSLKYIIDAIKFVTNGD